MGLKGFIAYECQGADGVRLEYNIYEAVFSIVISHWEGFLCVMIHQIY